MVAKRKGTDVVPVQDAAARALAIIGGPRTATPKHCMAHGCPLSGTFNIVIYDEGKSTSWQCFIHSDLPMSQWQQATAAINRNIVKLRTINDEYAFRSAMRDAVSGREVSEKYWQTDGVTRNAYLDSIRSARKT